MDRREHFSALMQQIREGSATAAQELLTHYGDSVLRVVRRRMHKSMRSRFDSQDFVQAVWASFFAVLSDKSEFAQPDELVAFLTRLAQHKVIEAVRERLLYKPQNVRMETEADEALFVDGRQLSPEQVAIAREEWERLLAFRPSIHQRILDLMRGGYDQGEIAGHVGLSQRTIGRIISDIRLQAGDGPGGLVEPGAAGAS